MTEVKQPAANEIRGHKNVRQALRDTQTYSSDLQGDADVRDYRQIPLEVDPPKHHSYRAALAEFFVRPTIEKHIPEFREISTAAVDKFMISGGDAVSELALPVVMHNLGVIYRRPQDVEEWISWGPDVWTAGGPDRDGQILHAYLDRVYQEALQTDSGDMWSELVRLDVDGHRISPLEFRGIAGVLLAGGRDTVVKLLAGMLWHLGRNHDDFELLRIDRELAAGAIPEFLRFLTPLPAMARTTVPESSTQELPADRYVQINFLSGNFDESVFDQPTRIDFRRGRIPHLSFGFGPHTCLGIHVAEIEAKVFLEVLLDRGLPWKVSDESSIRFHAYPLDMVPDHFEKLLVD